MRATLRRAPSGNRPQSPSQSIEVGDLRHDSDRHEVHLGAHRLNLPLKEFELLEFLMANAGRVLLRDTLIDRIWGHDYVGDTRTLDVHVRRLRAKIEDDPSKPRRLMTFRGLGYRLESGQ